jgi:hypothetical protein
LPGYGRETAEWLDDAAKGDAPVSKTIAALARRRGDALQGCWDLAPFAPAEGDDTPLATAALRLIADHGGAADEAAVRGSAAGVPLDLQKRLALVVGAIDLAALEVRAALGTSDATELKHLGRTPGLFIPSMSVGFDTDAEHIAKLDTVDLARIALAAALLAKVVEDADLDAVADAEFDPSTIETPIGRIVVRGSGADEYLTDTGDEDAALLFDLGGDDSYEVPAGASNHLVPVSVAIDARGGDAYGYPVDPDSLDDGLLPSDAQGRYHSSAPPTEDYGPITLSRTGRQGPGHGGIGLLFDLGPEADSYKSLAASQGAAGMGVGVLYDAGGDDSYDARRARKGSRPSGSRPWWMAGGNDVYRTFALSQGFGGSLGAAALVDVEGDDEYFADPGNPAVGGHPLYFSPQLPGTGNSSLAQGAAQGRRPISDTDAAYMAGGLGVLRDLGGRDHYTGSVFAQGVGYWQAIGLLLDGGTEADTYDAYWYTQGSTAHFALSLFVDEGGDDEYDLVLSPAATSIGCGPRFLGQPAPRSGRRRSLSRAGALARQRQRQRHRLPGQRRRQRRLRGLGRPDARRRQLLFRAALRPAPPGRADHRHLRRRRRHGHVHRGGDCAVARRLQLELRAAAVPGAADGAHRAWVQRRRQRRRGQPALIRIDHDHDHVNVHVHVHVLPPNVDVYVDVDVDVDEIRIRKLHGRASGSRECEAQGERCPSCVGLPRRVRGAARPDRGPGGTVGSIHARAGRLGCPRRQCRSQARRLRDAVTDVAGGSGRRRRTVWRTVAVAALCGCAATAVGAIVVSARAAPRRVVASEPGPAAGCDHRDRGERSWRRTSPTAARPCWRQPAATSAASG